MASGAPIVTVWNRARDQVLGSRVAVATGFWSRLRGLLGRGRLRRHEGLLIDPCRAVHMVGMRYPIDVAFLDPHRRVVATYDSLAPGRLTAFHPEARSALELPSGVLAATATIVGDLLELRPAADGSANE